MRKQILIIMIALLLVGTVIGAVTIANKNTEVSKPYKTALESINLGTYNYTDSEQGGLYQRCLYKKDVINTCSQWIDETQLDNWELARMEGIANATIVRQNANEIVIDKTGGVTITEKK